MKALVYKDIMLEMHELRRLALYYLLCMVGMPVLFALTSDDISHSYAMPLMMCPVISMVMINTTYGCDERSEWMRYAMTNPVTRIHYFHAKFLTHVVNVLCGSLLGFAISTVIAIVLGQLSAEVFTNNLSTAFGMLCGLLLVGLVTTPLMLKFGVQKGSMVMMMTVTGVVLLGTGINILGESSPIANISILVLGIDVGVTMYLLGRKWMLEKEF